MDGFVWLLHEQNSPRTDVRSICEGRVSSGRLENGQVAEGPDQAVQACGPFLHFG